MYGGPEGAKEIKSVYGTAVTKDLSEYMVFAGDTESAGKFDYEIISGNDNLRATINGDIITVVSNVPAGRYTLVIRASEKEPQGIMLMSVDYGTDDVEFSVTVNIEKSDKGTASVSMANYGCLETNVNPVPSSATNGVSKVTYEYKKKGEADGAYTSVKPTKAGE